MTMTKKSPVARWRALDPDMQKAVVTHIYRESCFMFVKQSKAMRIAAALLKSAAKRGRKRK